MISWEVICRDGSPVWRVTCGGIAVESPSGTQATAILEALEASVGIGYTKHEPLGPPQWGEPCLPDPGV